MSTLNSAAELDLIHQYAPLVRKIVLGVKRHMPPNVHHDDLLAAGMGGLWDAVRRRDGRSVDNFEWYVRVRVRGAIVDELRLQDWLPRRARARAEEASARGEPHVPSPAIVRFDDVSKYEMDRALSQDSTTELEAIASARAHAADAAVSVLSGREQFIVDQHYKRGAKFKDIATHLGVSEPRVSQIHKIAITRMRVELRRRGIRR